MLVFELQRVKADSWLNLIKLVAAFLGFTIKDDPMPFGACTKEEGRAKHDRFIVFPFFSLSVLALF